ncbi:MAG: DUF5655 domain-containing protein [Candidatus Promineifilaceae bacterium]
MTDELDHHFISREPVVREIYDKLMARLANFGGVDARPKKSSIHLTHRTDFAGVHPRKAYLNLEFKTERPIDHPRIKKSEQVSRNRYHNTVRLDSPEEVDEELMAWLYDSYQLSG